MCCGGPVTLPASPLVKSITTTRPQSTPAGQATVSKAVIINSTKAILPEVGPVQCSFPTSLQFSVKHLNPLLDNHVLTHTFQLYTLLWPSATVLP